MTIVGQVKDADRKGRPAWRRVPVWALYVLGFVPALWYFWLGASGQIPGNAIKEFEHFLGIWALRFLIATLLVTPLRDLTRINLMRYRRALGLLAFWYVVLHFTTYVVLDKGLNPGVILDDIGKRPFITIGMVCLVLLVPLALTSNAFSIRRLGRNWTRLHWLIYVIVLGGAVHYAMSLKVITTEPLIYLALSVLLVLYRPLRPLIRKRKGRR